MNTVQETVVILYGCASLWTLFLGYSHALRKRNVFGLTPYLVPLGVFVWGDAVVIGLFGVLASLILYTIHSWWLAVAVWSIFWVVRGVGETLYWVNQQFSPIERNPPSTLRGYRFFPNDSLWFVYQLVWQCLTVVFVVTALYSTYRWFGTLTRF